MRVEVEGGNLRVRWNLDLPATQVVEGLFCRSTRALNTGDCTWTRLYSPTARFFTNRYRDGECFTSKFAAAGAAPLSQTVRVIDGLKPRADLGSTRKRPCGHKGPQSGPRVDHGARSKGSLCLNHVQPGMGASRNFA